MGLDVYLKADDLPVEHEDLDSDKICKKNYLRSSYNEGGFNRVISRLTGENLWTIFGVTEEALDDDGCFVPDWQQAVKNATKVILALTSLQATGRNFRVTPASVESFFESRSRSDMDAIQIVNKELDRLAETNKKIAESGKTPPFVLGDYSNRDGDFFLENPLSVIAAIPGVDALQRPAIHLVYRDNLEWYIQVAEIAVELCVYAQTLTNPRLRWSH